MERFTKTLSHIKNKALSSNAEKNIMYESLRDSSDSRETFLAGSEMDAVRAELFRARRRSKSSTAALASLLVAVSLVWISREYVFWHISDAAKVHDYAPDKIKWVYDRTPEVFSPALEAVEYKEVVFRNNFHADRTKWQGPPDDDVDRAWHDLYVDVGVIKIPSTDADRLPNSTLPIPGDEGFYITGLEVYHQLHCLDLVRKHLYPDRYGADGGMSPAAKKEYWIHLEHCIDNLRQTIMCYADVSTIPWKFHERVQGNFPDAHTTHVCRDFDKLTEWMLHPDRHFPQEEYMLRVKAFQQGAL